MKLRSILSISLMVASVLVAGTIQAQVRPPEGITVPPSNPFVSNNSQISGGFFNNPQDFCASVKIKLNMNCEWTKKQYYDHLGRPFPVVVPPEGECKSWIGINSSDFYVGDGEFGPVAGWQFPAQIGSGVTQEECDKLCAQMKKHADCLNTKNCLSTKPDTK